MMMVEVDEGSPNFDNLWGNLELPSDFSQDSELDNLRFNDALTGVQTSEEIPGSGVVSTQNKFESLEAQRAYSDGFVECGWNSGVVNGGTVEHSSYISQGNDLFCRHEVLWTEDQISGLGGVPPEDNFETSVSWRACSDGSRGPSGESVFPYCEMLEPSSWTSQGNGLFDMHADGGSENAPSCKNDSEKASFEVQNHRERFNFDVSSHVFHDQQSSAKNGGDKAPFETCNYGETPFLHGFDHVIQMQDSSDFSHLKLQDDLVGITEYYAMTAAGNELNEPSNTLPNDYSKIRGHIKVKKNIDVIPSGDIVSRDSEIVDGAIYGGLHVPSSSKCLPLDSCKNYGLHSEDEAEDKIFESRRALPPLSVAGGTPIKRSVTAAHYQHSTLHVSELPGVLPPPSVEVESDVLKTENEVSKSKDGCLLKINHQGVQNNTCCQSNVNNDSDLCILENMSAPAPYHIATNEKLGTSKILTLSSPGNQIVTTNARRKPNNERVIFRVALQDLSQPKSEATPPDGVLSVPLLKHQRIALSWMANKETKSACCAGGILADDQGLGKTISTIALILKERPPSSKAPRINVKQSETETLNLDDDIDDASGAEGAEPIGCPINSDTKIPLPAKGRPSGGTLIVCPTSVLRQWSEELHSKVTGKAYLSVLVYYGSNRTKDPLELAKYDVVVTTYAIVTLEVPKQPVVNENDDHMGCSYKDSPSCGKRKIIDAISDRKSSMSKKSRRGIDNESLENVSGPLAQVRWFRIVLDEAQSIKNHRTQVARACWGLRAKRRWCLSGTPIQNAIDDLYSYFRFLRHEPYAVFRTFCEQIKVPIHRNPRNGYKKLQAVLKTVMLRRTKGTLIDGQPIINLPPKTIELRKIDFSKEERDFYSRLEADSRAQFAEYAAAGTVKQNYVNILLMLLRLRQACDHPLLVKGRSSRSKIDSSIEVAKKLSREKQNFLLSCLEASLAICGVCNDPPEDAVVTVCGHVFCNQCICEHITGDDTQCPTKKCKTHLTKSCVFSTTTLRMALSDQPSTETTANSEVAGPHALNCPQDSSKIRAALDILSSLTKPQDSSEKLYSTSEEMNRENGGGVKIVGEKAIVFSQWTGMLDLLEACLKSSSIQYRRLDGTMAVAARDRAIKDFTSLPEVSVMIMSLKAASLGLNMVAACNVLLLDLWWNPTTEDQAIDRAHRIGQTRPVSVFRLTVKDTVEDRILALQQKKRKMVAYAFGEDKSGSRQSRLTVEDLKYLFRVE